MMSRVFSDELASTRQQQWDHIRDYLAAYAARQPVSSVAVVGNAPLGPDEERAAAIDGADLVIRTNALVLDEPGSPPTVGRVCHAAIVSRATALTPWALQNYRDRAYLVPQAGYVQYPLEDSVGLLLETTFWPPDLGVMPLPNAVVKVRLADLLDPHRRPGSIIPTTGTTALFLAHDMFPEADILATGFSFLEDAAQTHWAHQSGGYTKVNWQHRLDLEQKLLQSWQADGSVRFLA